MTYEVVNNKVVYEVLVASQPEINVVEVYVAGPIGPVGDITPEAQAAKESIEATAEQVAQNLQATELARDDAQDARDGAQSERELTASIKEDTIAERQAAEAARIGAETARSGAEEAQSGANSAKTGAESARDAAQTARTGAETAQTGAANAKTAAESARDAAQTAKTGAETAQTGAQTAKTAAETAQTGAQTAKTAAETARDTSNSYAQTAIAAAVSALASASSASASLENLAVINKTVHTSTAIVTTQLYDTRKDSDGGAWRKRCAATSWENETLCSGKWLGEAATELAARGDNLLTYPEQLDNAAWSKSGTFSNGKLITRPAVDGAQNHYVQQNPVLAPSTMYIKTVEAKAGEYSWLYIQSRSLDGTWRYAYFNLATGVVGTVAAGMTAYISPVGDGFYKCSIMFSSATGATSNNGAYFVSSGNNVTTFVGDGTGGIYLRNAKLNVVGADASTYSASPELVTNGANLVNTNGWTAFGSAVLSAVSGALRIANADSSPAYGGCTQAISTVIGKTYRYSWSCTGGNSAAPFASVGTVSAGTTLGTSTAVAGSIVFTATATTTYFNFQVTGNTASQYREYNNISVKEVTTLTTPYIPYSSLSGSYYHNTTDGKYYSLNSTYGQTEVFRGNTRQFPSVTQIIAETTRVVIYDALTGAMWMAIVSSTGGYMYAGGNASSLDARNGKLFLGGSNYGLYVFDFVKELATRQSTAGTRTFRGSFAQRHSALMDASAAAVGALVNDTVNAVAAIILPEAPIDAATGVPVPTVAVATSGGVSVIKHDGTVVNSSNTTYADTVSWLPNTRLNWTYFGHVAESLPAKDLAAGFASNGGVFLGGALTAYSPKSGNNYLPPPIISTFYATKVAKDAAGGNLGVVRTRKGDKAEQSMVAGITLSYNTGWMNGDIRSCVLADTVAETITASGELVTNGTFDTDTTGWTAARASTLSVASGALVITYGGTDYPQAQQTLTVVANRTYRLTATQTAGAQLSIAIGSAAGGNQYGSAAGSGVVSITFTPTSTLAYVTLQANATGNVSVTVDNVSCKLATPDRSVKNNGLVINGSLTKTAVATAAQLVAYSGFSTSNFLEQPYNSGLDFGTGDFCVMGWIKASGTSYDESLFYRRDLGGTGAGIQVLKRSTSGYIRATLIGAVDIDTTVNVSDGNWHFVVFMRVSGTNYIYVDGVQAASNVNATNLTSATASTRIGLGLGTAAPAYQSSLALWRVGATAPSADQISHIYNTEKKLFEANAKCVIDGTSAAVTTMEYDSVTDLLHVGTSWGRSAFKDLVRVESEATTVGAIKAISAYDGQVCTAGASAAKVYIPAKSLRDELNRRAEQQAAFGRPLVPQDFDATASQTDFTLPLGFTPKFVYAAGSIKRLGSTKDYTLVDDGFRVTVKFNAGLSASTWVSILCERAK